MYTLIAQNKYGDQLELTHNEAYVITNIVGIDPPDAVINTTRNANADGSVFNSAYVDNRQITITLAINKPAEANRIQLYQYFKTKYPIRLYYQNSTRNVYVDGFTQNISINFFNKKEIAQITILCPNTFFNGVNDSITEFSTVESLFEFPFSIEESANLLKVTASSTTVNGITFTVNDDGTVTADGTATDNAYLVLGSVKLSKDITYALNGCPEGGGNSTYRLYWQGVTGNYDEGEGTTYRPDSNGNVNIRIVVYEGATVEDLVFKPMVRVSNMEDDTYMEYGDPPGAIEFSRILINEETNVINGGDIDTGAIIEIQAVGQVVNPGIYNVETNEYFIINTTMNQGDVITINTRKKEKSVTLLRAGVITTLIGSVKFGSSWLQLAPGDNTFIVNADTFPENMLVTFTVVNQFEGV